MQSLFDQLLQRIAGGSATSQTFLALGLLIEREKTHRPHAHDDGGVRQILGDDYAQLQLSQDEIRHAVQHLINYLQSEERPNPTAVWALAKSYEPEVVPTLISLLRRSAADPKQIAVARNALGGVIACGVKSIHSDESLNAIRDVAKSAAREIQEEARDYLEHYAQVSHSR
jgi:hypothetical protein